MNKIVEHVFIDVPDFLRRTRTYPSAGWIFRGQADKTWPLLPKVGRDDYFDPEWDKKRAEDPRIPPQDIGRFNAWREKVVAYSDDVPGDNPSREVSVLSVSLLHVVAVHVFVPSAAVQQTGLLNTFRWFDTAISFCQRVVSYLVKMIA